MGTLKILLVAALALGGISCSDGDNPATRRGAEGKAESEWADPAAAPADGAVFHVAPDGDDANPGTNEEPFKTISKAASVAAAGDTVKIRTGVYREAVRITQSGTPDRRIRFEAAPASNVVVTGADVISAIRVDESEVVVADWPHKFIGWNEQMTHPNDIRHRMIGRCEQVFVGGYPLLQVSSREELARGTFFADTEEKKLYVRSRAGIDLISERVAQVPQIEASTRQIVWEVEGNYVTTRGIRFRYAANMAQHGAVSLKGDHAVLEDCVIEHMNGPGASFNGQDITVRRCTFRDNGQLGFKAAYAHKLLITECLVEHNNTKDFSRGWEAGASKIALSRDVVVEKSQFVRNRGIGVWFDVGNENGVVRNNLIADNENAGIFYEISYGLHAHDNVIIGNGLSHRPGAWGANGGISLSSSPGCVIERNLIVANREGFQFREQNRVTALIGQREPRVAIWNHDNIIRNNILAYNRDFQFGGWFDGKERSHWPAAMRDGMPDADAGGEAEADMAADYLAKGQTTKPNNLSLEMLNFTIGGNLYSRMPGQELFLWGVPWQHHKIFNDLAGVMKELGLEKGSKDLPFEFQDYLTRDFRVPADSPALRMGAYPRGEVPGVKLGIIARPGAQGRQP